MSSCSRAVHIPDYDEEIVAMTYRPGTSMILHSNHHDYEDTVVVVQGESMTIDDVTRVARHGAKVRLTDDDRILRRITSSAEYVQHVAQAEEPLYGVTTGFGGMSNVVIGKEALAALQSNLLWSHKTGAGNRLPIADVRAAMLLRANSLARGASGIRLELIQRIVQFLNAGVTPHVYELGSIGASGDLVPLAHIAGALIGLDRGFTVDFQGDEVDAHTALQRLGLSPLELNPKEGLALINGTSVMAGIAANCVHQARILFALGMGVHALYAQALMATNQSFHPFTHQHKPHPGQRWTADQMLRMLEGSHLIRDELDGHTDHGGHDLIQDRYSLRCLPQYAGPTVEGLQRIARQIEIEANSATDNPLIDIEHGCAYHGGNFLGEYVGVAMDQLRYYISLQAQHLDAQIALLVAPEFNRGLPASLVGNPAQKTSMGLKALQITGNSIMPLLAFYGNSLADRFPTHAEQFNQNINSQGFGSANLTRQSIRLFQQYTAVALMFAIQAVALRTFEVAGHYDARQLLSPATVPLYETVYQVLGCTPSADRPYIWNDHEQSLDAHIACLAADIAGDGKLAQAAGNAGLIP